MLNVELKAYGLNATLNEIIKDLYSVLGSNGSKKEKDQVIHKTLGAVKAISHMIQVAKESEDGTVEESGFLI